MARGCPTEAEWRIVEPHLPTKRGRKSRPVRITPAHESYVERASGRLPIA